MGLFILPFCLGALVDKLLDKNSFLVLKICLWFAAFYSYPSVL